VRSHSGEGPVASLARRVSAVSGRSHAKSRLSAGKVCMGWNLPLCFALVKTEFGPANGERKPKTDSERPKRLSCMFRLCSRTLCSPTTFNITSFSVPTDGLPCLSGRNASLLEKSGPKTLLGKTAETATLPAVFLPMNPPHASSLTALPGPNNSRRTQGRAISDRPAHGETVKRGFLSSSAFHGHGGHPSSLRYAGQAVPPLLPLLGCMSRAGCLLFSLLLFTGGLRAEFDPALVKVMEKADIFGEEPFEGDVSVNARGQWIAAT
jgi:hypothetical protein